MQAIGKMELGQISSKSDEIGTEQGTYICCMVKHNMGGARKKAAYDVCERQSLRSTCIYHIYVVIRWVLPSKTVTTI